MLKGGKSYLSKAAQCILDDDMNKIYAPYNPHCRSSMLVKKVSVSISWMQLEDRPREVIAI
jgi:hypothetical protein